MAFRLNKISLIWNEVISYLNFMIQTIVHIYIIVNKYIHTKELFDGLVSMYFLFNKCLDSQ